MNALVQQLMGRDVHVIDHEHGDVVDGVIESYEVTSSDPNEVGVHLTCRLSDGRRLTCPAIDVYDDPHEAVNRLNGIVNGRLQLNMWAVDLIVGLLQEWMSSMSEPVDRKL